MCCLRETEVPLGRRRGRSLTRQRGGRGEPRIVQTDSATPPPQPLVQWIRALCSGAKAAGALGMTGHLHVVPRLRMNGTQR